MSLTSTMWSGLSGLNATASSLAITSDNIANVNTVGYRGSRAQFEDMLTRSVYGVGQIGTGTRISSIQKLFEQGSVVGTTSNSDMAITGRGFFVVRGNYNGIEGTLYTRAGQFIPDKEGYLVNPQGLRVQGYNADADGNISKELGDLLAAEPTIRPRHTDKVDMTVTLTSASGNPLIDIPNVTPAPYPQTFDPANTDASTFFSTGITVFDSLGQAHPATVHFSRTNEHLYTWNVTVDGGRLTGGASGTPTTIFGGDIEFTTDGKLKNTTQRAGGVNFVGATANQVIEWDFGNAIDQGGDGSGSNSSGIASGDNIKIQNGYTAGAFTDMTVDGEGIVTSIYSNGHAKVVGRVAVADFRAMEELNRIGGTMFRQTDLSGEAFIGYANTGGRGQIVGEALEQANVDISTEFIRLITDQRAYQAHSRTITTADELMGETVNLKR